MNAGLSNLATLKSYLLAASLQATTTYDAGKIIPIGLGVAAMIDTWCNRKFAYLDPDTDIVSGDRSHIYLRRYPINVVQQVNMRYFITDNWTNITGEPIRVNPLTGLLSFGYTLGRFPLQVQILWSGGCFYEQLEPTDAGFPTTPPTGSTPLPADVQLAWLMMCAEVWNKSDKLGAGLADNPDQVTKTGSLELPPLVKTLLQPYKRFQLT